MSHFDMNNKWTTENFEIYDSLNPKIYFLFEKFSLEAAKKKKHFSAKCIFHRIRWETEIGNVGKDFKIDDGWISHYARKFVRLNPAFEDFFEFRVRRISYHNESNAISNNLQGFPF
jgi:hypothetical protein